MQAGYQPEERELTLPPAFTYALPLILTIKNQLVSFNASLSSNETCDMSIHENPVSLRNVAK